MWNRARRSNEGLALLMIDIDHFMPLNDKFDHQAGDVSLCTVAQALASSATRASDMVAQYGGEDFTVVLPSIRAEDAGRIAEIMRVAVERLQLTSSRPIGRVTVSIGVGFVRPHGMDDPSILIAATDAALYEAKRAGRNRVAQRNLSPGESTSPQHETSEVDPTYDDYLPRSTITSLGRGAFTTTASLKLCDMHVSKLD